MDIKRLRALCEAATPGPWDATSFPSRIVTQDGTMIVDFIPMTDDAKFIAIARTALPKALDEIEQLQKERDEAIRCRDEMTAYLARLIYMVTSSQIGHIGDHKVYVSHIDVKAVDDILKTALKRVKEIAATGPIGERIGDAINYLALIDGIIEEARGEEG